MKKRTLTCPPGVVAAVLAAAAGSGWLAGGGWGKSATLPAPGAPSTVGAETRKSSAAGTRPPADPTVQAAVEWLRAASILTRNPRDYAAELAANLGEPNEVLRDWAAADGAACWAWFQRDLRTRAERLLVQDGTSENLADETVTAIIAGREAEAFALLATLSPTLRGSFAGSLTTAALRLPPAEAMALLAKYPGAWHADDSAIPDNAMELLAIAGPDKRFSSHPKGREMLSDLMEKSASRDPLAAGRWWLAQSPEVQGATATGLLIASKGGPPPWDAETMSALVGCVLENTSAESAGTLLAPWLAHLTKTDLVGTMKWTADHLPVDAWRTVVGHMEGQWTAESLLSVAEVVPPRFIDQIIAGLRRDSTATEVPAATARVETLLAAAPGSAAHQLGVRLLESLSAGSPLVRDWVERAPADQVTPQLLEMAASNRLTTTKDPAAVLAWLDSLEGKPVASTAASIAESWYETAPEKTASAVLALPEGPSRAAGIRAAHAWLETDLPAALTWLESLPPTDRPHAIQAVRNAPLSNAARRAILEKWGVPDTPAGPAAFGPPSSNRSEADF